MTMGNLPDGHLTGSFLRWIFESTLDPPSRVWVLFALVLLEFPSGSLARKEEPWVAVVWEAPHVYRSSENHNEQSPK